MRILTLCLLILGSVTANATSSVLGSAQAEVKILIAGDMECPYTAKVMDYIPGWQAEFGETVAVQYLHLPLDFHENAFSAAIASECAEEQNLFWPFLLKAFESYRDLGPATYVSVAREVGVPDLEAFKSCMKSDKMAKRVEQETATSRALGINGTPYVYINGTLFKGAYPYDEMASAIRSAAAGE